MTSNFGRDDALLRNDSSSLLIVPFRRSSQMPSRKHNDLDEFKSSVF